MRARSIGAAAATGLGLVAVRDLVQKKHALLRNFPLVGHARYVLETIGPEPRQYIVTSNDEERPFSRDQRSWIYASAKGEDNYFGFGTDNDVEHVQGHEYVKQRTFADALPDLSDPQAALPSAKVLGGPRGRAKAFRPASVINISAMSFGSLSGAAVTAGVFVSCGAPGWARRTGSRRRPAGGWRSRCAGGCRGCSWRSA